ncbi:MAG TPA: hypothetical protein VF655_11570 [Allosphingosinicella sp.]|jgi:hypothetical protein
MSLADDLTRTRTEEDVKDAYIKALGLKSYFKGLVDIQTEEVWFEAKDAPTPAMVMFGQLLVYVRAAKNRGDAIPAFLAVIDREKAAIMPTEPALPLFDDLDIDWPPTGSKVGRQFAAQIAPSLQPHIVEYEIAHDEASFIKAIKDAIRERRIIRTGITPDNLRQVFDRWVGMVGSELGSVNPADYAVLFFADIMHDGRQEAMTNLPARLLFSGDKPVFLLNGESYELASQRGYRNFWAIYHRPPEAKHRHYLLERRDSLLPLDEQKFKGAYYTPLHIVDKAYDELKATLGANWQDRYLVWDMCAGVGNLEAKHSNLRNVFMSTLDQADVTIMRSNPAFAGAEIFQYDYLNDDITDFGEIDYSLSNKLPLALRQAISDAKAGAEDAKPVLVLINPPYGEAANSQGNAGKTGIATTRISHGMADLGYAARELFVQFLHRIMLELPTAKLAMFSTLKYVNAPNFEAFRKRWTAKYLGGFLVHSKAFEGITGNFPIGFLLWDASRVEPANKIAMIALDRAGRVIGEKTIIDLPNTRLLTSWIRRVKARSQSIPLKNAITPQMAHAKVTSWDQNAIGYLLSNSNDLQNAGTKTAIFSSVYSAGNGYHVTPGNLWQAAVVFAVRMLIPHTWQNHNDQFLQPAEPLDEDFKSDCLVWMLFAGKNLTAGADGLRWNDREWSLVNHFLPFTEAEVGAAGRFESDFMARHIRSITLTPEAQGVLDEGRALFRRFHSIQFPRKIREELRLGRADAGWYQVRHALEAYADTELTDFDPMRTAYSALTAKLRPMVYSLGFLPE